MALPPGISHDSGYVCKLKKALYDLKQAPRAWFEKFSIVISSLGFVSSSHDSALFIITTWLLNKHCLIQLTVQKCTLHVKLVHTPPFMNCKS